MDKKESEYLGRLCLHIETIFLAEFPFGFYAVKN